MKHYKHTNLSVWAYEPDGSQDELIPADAVLMTAAEVEAHKHPLRVTPVPEFVEMVQARLALLHAGHLATVKAAIAAMPGIEGEEARETWEFAPRVRRDSSLVAAMGVLLSLTDKQLDDLFLDAATR